ncbi:SpoIVB peptidase [Clostridium tertium]|jgi:stage IV sporulation protein B|uniref:SpoIVB peptidase n=1 Tax=Clostridium TaxID=1485 RepID=UPI00019B03F0|nr:MULTISPECIES: SpoIVB peptidase [Clostridium]EEH97690.1 stage IV sporulation protein B [Clostridium sp. 7_2_43FAA]MBS5306528.1 SpoIVB peptidase [Clostridium sp.]MBU6135191.1 SpoIVB peptidase [Clostridium tertium]MDB1923336.1 SpoIVB peptidase [Clostridium tertium]MDB1927019.1 SpoIVB peptidase [Clostridium tertium]
MRMKKLKYLGVIITPMLILGLITFFSLSSIPEKIYVNEAASTSDVVLSDNIFMKNSKIKKDKLQVKLLGFIPVKSVAVSKVNDLEVYPGGTSVGIKLSTKGVLVVGHSDIESVEGKVESPAKNSGIELGDVLIKINGEEIQSSKDLSKKIKNLDNSKINVDYIRNGNIEKKEIDLEKENNEYKLGLWVRDSTAGIGTLTFYDKNTSIFGALGHPITDGDTNKPFIVRNGDLLNSSVISVRKGEKGSPGELKGLFVNEKESLATIEKNTEAGIFGEASADLVNPTFNKPLKVGFRNEIKEGAAKIITTIDENGPKMYDIEIVKLLPQEEPGPKSMVIKVTDEELLEKTGGIVQGMSGSPIIQDNKLVGAVTHVLINKPDVGYGIYIEWMLKDAGVIE